MIGVLDFGFNTLLQAAHVDKIRGLHMSDFNDDVLAAGDGRPTVIVLGSACVRHGIDEARRQRWLIEIAMTFCSTLPAIATTST
ncbi:hypothetical protein H0X90_31040 [Burkholderia sp. 9775_39]|uniref:hypothetical protein n=1 Tax=unclassified Burkholderia TaxID=2613784 RepID=UPI0018C375DB|nr:MULTISPECIES: hypothetical protein [unclassified Burkholderia]MBG0881244.1 hypothetical protein [Burkholderia sp. 9775_39]MBG0887679.1 hypothetical protein [Burkholderia sp. 9773_38]